MDMLLGLAKDGSGWTLFVLAVTVNIFQYKLLQKIQDKRIDDWQTVLNTTNDLAKTTADAQKTMGAIITGIDQTLKILLDRMDRKK